MMFPFTVQVHKFCYLSIGNTACLYT